MVTYNKGMNNGVIEISKEVEKSDRALLEKTGKEYDFFMKEFNLDVKDRASGWKKKMGNDKFKDGYRCNFY